MFVREAKARCPHLMIVPYDFDAYGEVYLSIPPHFFCQSTAFVRIDLLQFSTGC